MSNFLPKVLLMILTIILMSRSYISWIKSKKDSKYGIVAIIVSTALIGLLIYVELFQTTMFEFLLFLVIAMLLFVFRKRIGGFLKKLSSPKRGKIKVTAAVMLFPVGIWLALALFYRTPLGMPIGVKNYLYHKYDEEFETAGFWAATPAGHPINEFTCWPKNGNKQTDSFNVVRKNTLSVGSRNFASDNYYGVFIRNDYENFVSELLAQYFEDFEVEVNFNWSGLSNTLYMSDELDKTFTLNEFLEFQKVNGESCNTAEIKIIFQQRDEIDKGILLEFSDKYSDKTRMAIVDFYVENKQQLVSYITINSNGTVKFYEN